MEEFAFTKYGFVWTRSLHDPTIQLPMIAIPFFWPAASVFDPSHAADNVPEKPTIQVDCLGFYSANREIHPTYGEVSVVRTGVWIVPYWPILLPLTLLSTWLLRSKPRKKLTPRTGEVSTKPS